MQEKTRNARGIVSNPLSALFVSSVVNAAKIVFVQK